MAAAVSDARFSSAQRVREGCTCGSLSMRILAHGDRCGLFACPACGAGLSEEHKPDCSDRCVYCGSEGSDLDHCDGCPTIGTCAQCYRVPREQGWHFDPPGLTRGYGVWLDAHMAEFHPGVPKW